MTEAHGPESEARTRKERINPMFVAQGWQVEESDLHVSLDFLGGKLIREGQTRGRIAELGIAAATKPAFAALLFEGVIAQSKTFLRRHVLRNYEEMRTLAAGGVQPAPSPGLTRDSEILLPPLDEEAEIVHRVEALLTIADSIESRLADATAQVEKTTQAILAMPFEVSSLPFLKELNPIEHPVSVADCCLAFSTCSASPSLRRCRATTIEDAILLGCIEMRSREFYFRRTQGDSY